MVVFSRTNLYCRV